MRGNTVVAFCLLIGAVGAENKCEERGKPTPDFPTQDTKCFKEDLVFDDDGINVTEEAMRPIQGKQTCNQFVRCNQTSCSWQPGECPSGLFFNGGFDECDEPIHADCAASLFGPKGRKVSIENPERGLVIFDCQGCLNIKEVFPKDSPVVGYETDPGFAWQWKLIAEKREGSRSYTFAFDKDTGGGRFKMLTDKSNTPGLQTQVWSSNFPSSRDNIDWQIVPNPDDLEKFRIRNPQTGQYLVMSDKPLDKVFFGNRTVNKVVMQNLDFGDPAQLWKFTFLD